MCERCETTGRKLAVDLLQQGKSRMNHGDDATAANVFLSKKSMKWGICAVARDDKRAGRGYGDVRCGCGMENDGWMGRRWCARSSST